MSFVDASGFSIEAFIAISLVSYFFSGFVKGTLGLGMPITAVCLMSFVADARTAVLLVLIPVVMTNLWQIIRTGQLVQTFQRYWKLTFTMTFFLLVTSSLAVEVSLAFIMLSVGTAVILFASLNLFFNIPSIPTRLDSAAQVTTGLFTGVLGGMTGLIVVPLVAYFSACNLNKDSFVAATSPFFLLGGGLLILSYTRSGLFVPDVALLSTLLVLPAVVGLLVGERIRRLLPGDQFKRLVLMVFLLMGVNLMYKGMGLYGPLHFGDFVNQRHGWSISTNINPVDRVFMVGATAVPL